jgi:LPXTG-site transpeptidase (sortase) family protein
MNRTFLIRFFGYFFILSGSLAMLFQFGPVALAELSYRADQVLNIQHTLVGDNSSQAHTFGQITAHTEGDNIQPVSTDFGVVIEKIDANAKVVPNVDPTNETEYRAALQQGIAEAAGSTSPGQPGNLFLFSHSADSAWDIARYNAIFYLLRELNPGDRVVIFYHGVRYNYDVFDKTVVSPKDVSFLTNRYDKPVLTLQTCDPPGTSLNRLIVRAKLVGS